MRKLLAATFLTPVWMLAASPVTAETVISTAVTTPLLTGTLNDNIRITTAGSVKPASGAAVTINSNHSVKNEGAIAIQGANNSAGILANINLTGNITNSGTITIDENYTATDSDSDGDLDGPFAQGTGRFGIRVLPGGTFTGTITNSGSITVEGNQSAGIAIDSALTGSIANSGSITVIGNDSFGLRASDVSGNITLSTGAISARGANAVGVALDGDIGGALVIQNSVTATGYRSTVAPADVSKLDADDLLQGGPAVRIAGDVAGGILLDARPKDNSTTDTDEDDDGVADANESTASVTSYGSSAALQVGSASGDTTIGAVASSTAGHGLVIKGIASGLGVYKGVSATGVSIGGTGHAVSIAGGMTVDGTVQARAVEANSTALRIGAGASVPEINVGGTISAQGGGTASTGAQAILIDTGATVATIRNSGLVVATRNGTEGTAGAIVDKSGSVSLIENSGTIGVVDAVALGDKAIAFDLSANAGGATVRQLAVASDKPAPGIAGTMLFGGGNDLLDIDDGSVTGAAKFAGGDNQLLLAGDSTMNSAVSFGAGADRVELGGTSSLIGSLDFGGGADILALTGGSRFSGTLANSAGVAANVGAGSTLDVTNLGGVDFASLTTGAGSTIGVTIDSAAGTNTLYNVAGAANFGTDTTVAVRLTSIGGVAGSYTILNAGSLTGAGNLGASIGLLPFLYDSSLSTTVPNQVSLVVRLKSAEELGLNDSEGDILGAVLDAADSDAGVSGVFLDILDQDTLTSTLQQMLPDHAGGVFETVTKGSRLSARVLADPRGPVIRGGGLGMWVEQIAWGSSKSIGNTSSYKLGGWGAAGGLEYGLGGAGHVGVMLGYHNGKDRKGANELVSTQLEAGAYWRGAFGPFNAHARASAGRVSFDGTRQFSGTADGQEITRTAEADWKGSFTSAAAGIGYEARMGRLAIRPAALVEHYSLTEKAYEEQGGGTAFDLNVERRKSSETAANLTLALGYDLLGTDPGEGWMKVDLEGGRRQIIGGKLGSTTARFADGDPFTLDAEQRESGWLAALKLSGGGTGYSIVGEVNAEQQRDNTGLGGRVSLHFGL